MLVHLETDANLVLLDGREVVQMMMHQNVNSVKKVRQQLAKVQLRVKNVIWENMVTKKANVLHV